MFIVLINQFTKLHFLTTSYFCAILLFMAGCRFYEVIYLFKNQIKVIPAFIYSVIFEPHNSLDFEAFYFILSRFNHWQCCFSTKHI